MPWLGDFFERLGGEMLVVSLHCQITERDDSDKTAVVIEDDEATDLLLLHFLSRLFHVIVLKASTNRTAIPYDAVRKAVEGEPYAMSLTVTDEILAVIEAVNQGINSHLEACIRPERGDQ